MDWNCLIISNIWIVGSIVYLGLKGKDPDKISLDWLGYALPLWIMAILWLILSNVE